MANEFRLGLLKDCADKIRPDLTKARQMLEKAEAEKRELTADEKVFVDPVIKEARDIADSRQRTHEEDATKELLRREFDGITGPIGGSLSGDKTRRISFKGMGAQVAAAMMPDGAKVLAPSGAAVVGQEMKAGPGGLGPTGAVSARRDPGRDTRPDRVRLPAADGADQRCGCGERGCGEADIGLHGDQGADQPRGGRSPE